MEAFIAKEAIIAGHILFSQVLYDVYGLAKETTTHPQLSQAMTQMDLGADLKVIEALVKKIERKQSTSKVISSNDPLSICLEQIEEMVVKIRKDLEEINKLLKEHKEKYFANWRSTGCDPIIERLKAHKKALDSRVNRLLQVTQM